MKTVNTKNRNPYLFRYSITGLILFFMMSTLAYGESTSWPKVITAPNGEITVYQPEPENLNGNIVSGRAAVAVKHKDSKRPTFGAIWITGTLEVDRETRTAVLSNIKIPNIRFSADIDSTVVTKISNLIEQEMPKWNLVISMDDLIATLNSNAGASDKFKNNAPEIIIAYKPSILVLINGKPILKPLQDNEEFEQIVNSPYFIIYDGKKKEYYIYSETYWMVSNELTGTWGLLEKESSKLKKLREQILKSNPPADSTSVTESTTNIPDVIVRETPAELISFDGQPDFKPIEKTNLLYVENTNENVFMDIESQNYYILISGRWYISKSIDGPWTYTDADKLPADFAKIPPGSKKDNVLASVAGTNAAKDAVLDAQIPQTAEVDRKTATAKVTYDGDPKFEKVDGTSMLYAVNSPETVLKVGDKYYCVDNGVWFVANEAQGPWQVADSRPAEVDDIEPSSPVYNVKYVYIYDSTPDVVYVGYTPGYYGNYIYGPTVIYGTGFYYDPWYGSLYYPRPLTWGFGMSYNPFTGWGIGFGVGFGPITVGFGWGGFYGGYWGCPAFRPPYCYPGGGFYGPGYRPPYPGGRPPGYGGGRPPVNGRPSTGPANNIYGNRAGVNSNISNRMNNTPSNINREGKTSKLPDNNVFTDKNGNVFRQNNNGNWQSRQGNNWKSTDKLPSGSQLDNRMGNNGFGNSFDRGSLDRQAANRNRGQMRTNNFNNFSGGFGGGRGGFGGGGMRGGGFRR